MRYAAAYLLAVLGGNQSPMVTDMAKILGSVGIDCDEKRAQAVVDACKGKNVEEIIADGMAKIDNVSMQNTETTIKKEPIKAVDLPKSSSSRPHSPSPPGSPGEGGMFDLFG